MRFPVLGTIDLKSVVIGALFVWFVMPWLMGMVTRFTSGNSGDE